MLIGSSRYRVRARQRIMERAQQRRLRSANAQACLDQYVREPQNLETTVKTGCLASFRSWMQRWMAPPAAVTPVSLSDTPETANGAETIEAREPELQDSTLPQEARQPEILPEPTDKKLPSVESIDSTQSEEVIPEKEASSLIPMEGQLSADTPTTKGKSVKKVRFTESIESIPVVEGQEILINRRAFNDMKLAMQALHCQLAQLNNATQSFTNKRPQQLIGQAVEVYMDGPGNKRMLAFHQGISGLLSGVLELGEEHIQVGQNPQAYLRQEMRKAKDSLQVLGWVLDASRKEVSALSAPAGEALVAARNSIDEYLEASQQLVVSSSGKDPK